MSTSQAKEFFGEKTGDIGLCGLDELDDLVERMEQSIGPRRYSDMTPAVAPWCNPPQHFLDQIAPLQLNDAQQEIIKRIKQRKKYLLTGVAGSGKSLVLAELAASLAEQGKRVLVLTFNITIWHFLRDLTRRSTHQFQKSLVTFIHYHGFARTALRRHHKKWPEGDNWDIRVTEILSSIGEAIPDREKPYDAILIDEGQDYSQAWYEALLTFLHPDGRVVVAADAAQDIYKPAMPIEFTALESAGKTLTISYRLPGRIRVEAERFTRMYLPERYVHGEAPIELGLEDPQLFWRTIAPEEELNNVLERGIWWFVRDRNVHPSDIVILVPTHEMGRDVTAYLESRGFQVNHIFGNTDANGDEDDGVPSSRRAHGHKTTFEMGVGKLRVCTYHSFKGWELSTVFAVVPDDEELGMLRDNDKWSDELFYVALTRTRSNMVVFNRSDRYAEYGKGWAVAGP